jgi:L-threonylcarbamoyladenylate synthase
MRGSGGQSSGSGKKLRSVKALKLLSFYAFQLFMRVIKINRHRISRRALEEAVRVLSTGGVVAYPTDTAYGLAADPSRRSAVARIFAIKGREKGKPLPLIAASIGQAKSFVIFGGLALKMARLHWPGPLTIVAPRRAVGRAIAIRGPASAGARGIAKGFGGPITSTSANVSGRPATYSGNAVARMFKNRNAVPDLLLDAGTLPLRPASTIVAVRRGKIVVLRQGLIKVRIGKMA